MKNRQCLFGIFLPVLFFLAAGCEPLELIPKLPTGKKMPVQCRPHSGYLPARIHIVPLTKLISPDSNPDARHIRVFVSLLDSFGSEIKSPAVFRFELYKRVVRSAQSKGKRITIWPDIDLTNPDKNNKYWRDFLGAYEFSLDATNWYEHGCVLQVTSTCPNGKRLSAQFNLSGSN